MRKQFSETQNIAINHYTGPCLVLAGPGSGKTTVITNRTKNLIEKYGVNPSNILVITFTKAAAVEMQERFIKLMDGVNAPVSFGTFHAIFFKILKFAYGFKAENILREEERYKIVTELVQKEKLELDDEKEFVSNILMEMGNVKGDMISLDNYYSGNCSNEVFRRIFNGYDNILRSKNKIDFDDMMTMCHELFCARRDILSAWQNKYKFILIDEFQDINRIQYEIIKLLAKPEDNIFIVGDDDQSIYRFRGARPEIMLNFERDYESSKRIVLNENYRSEVKIVKDSLKLISNNKNRFEKKIHATKSEMGTVEYCTFRDGPEENKKIIEEINDFVKNGGRFSDVAVLFRTNTGPRFLVDKLMEYNIPFHMKDIMPNIYEHFIAKDIICYVNVARGERKRESFLKILNRPKRYLSRESLAEENVNFSKLKQFYSDKYWVIERIEKLEYDLQMIGNMSPYAAINYIRKGVGYDEFIAEYAEYRRMNAEDLYLVLDELEEKAKEFKNYDEWFEHIDEYGEELKNQSDKNRKIENAVELCTMHSAKGLEFERVYIIDAVEGVTPHNKAGLLEDIEEERRLFYVAATRAKKYLKICSVKERFGKPVEISRFVTEMNSMTDELKEGMKVRHIKYGEGEIISVSGKKIEIFFAKNRKQLVFDADYAFGNKIVSLI